MKKNLLLIVALFVATSMSAQFYIGAKVGYGLGTQKSVAGTTLTADAESNNWVSLGQGVTPGLKLGYFFNDNFGIELQMNYFLGSKMTAVEVTTVMPIMPGVTANIQGLGEAQSTQFRLLPAFVYKFDNGLYGRFGLVMPVSGKTVITSTTTVEVTGTPASTSEDETEVHGKFAWGYTGALGYSFELNDNMSLFGEVEYVALTIRAKDAEITKSTTDGTDNLVGADVYDLKTNYVDELTATSNNEDYNPNFDATKPMDELGISNGYSSVRFNIGITMSF